MLRQQERGATFVGRRGVGLVALAGTVALVLAASAIAVTLRPWAGRSYGGRLGDYFNNAPHWTRAQTESASVRVTRDGRAVRFYGRYFYYCGGGTSHLSAPALVVTSHGRFASTAHALARYHGKVTGTNYFMLNGRFVDEGRKVQVSYLDDFVYPGKHVSNPYSTRFEPSATACESWVHGSLPASR